MDKALQNIGFCGVKCEDCAEFKAGGCKGCRAEAEIGESCYFQQCCRIHEAKHCGMCPEFVCTDILEFGAESQSHAEALERLSALRLGESIE